MLDQSVSDECIVGWREEKQAEALHTQSPISNSSVPKIGLQLRCSIFRAQFPLETVRHTVLNCPSQSTEGSLILNISKVGNGKNQPVELCKLNVPIKPSEEGGKIKNFFPFLESRMRLG